MQFVSFELGDETFCVEVHRTREILSLAPITKVPQTPHDMLGVINLRGQVVPVIDMRLKFGMPDGGSTEKTCIIVMEVRCEEAPVVIGALVDAVSEVLDLKDDQIEPAPRLGSRLNSEVISGMGKVEDQFLILLDIDKVFSAEDITLVSDLGQTQPNGSQEKAGAEA